MIRQRLAKLLFDHRTLVILRRAALLGALALGVVLRVRTTLTDLTLPHATTIPDDSFYDFGIARHLAIGEGPTFDGFTPTNGFHPLWVALLVPIWALAPPLDRVGPIHAAMALGSAFDIASLCVLWWICRKRLTLSSPASLVVVGWLAASPYQTMIATCGLEAPLAQLLLLLLLEEELATRWRPVPRVRWGVLAGLTLLARADLGVIIFVLLVARLHRNAPTWGARVDLVRGNLVAPAVACTMYAPWLVYSRVTTGRWIQSSVVALPFSVSELPRVFGYATITVRQRIEMSANALLDAANDSVASLGAGVPLGAAALGCGVVAMALVRSPRARALSPYVVGLASLLVIHGAVRRVFRDWYAFPFTVGYVVSFGHALHVVMRREPRRWLVLVLTVAVVATGLRLEWRDRERTGYSGYYAYPPSVAPFTERSGDTDGGMWGYFAGGNRANLDGIVNWDALDALEAGNLLDYVERAHIVHFEVAERYRSPRFFGRRWRERLVVEPDGYWRIAATEEKDRKIVLGTAPVAPSSLAGEELLSDGWYWPERLGDSSIRSMGPESEIVFVAADASPANQHIALELASLELVDGSRCRRITAKLDGRPVGFVDIDAHFAWYSYDVGELTPGRHQLTLRPDRIGAVDMKERWREADWRAVYVNMLTAFHLRSLRVSP